MARLDDLILKVSDLHYRVGPVGGAPGSRLRNLPGLGCVRA